MTDEQYEIISLNEQFEAVKSEMAKKQKEIKQLQTVYNYLKEKLEILRGGTNHD